MEDLSTLLVGDLLWSRIAGYPYWPCMISYDPLQGMYKTMKNAYKSEHVVYHVQYFGDQAEHGWTTPKNIMLYEGKEKFEFHIEQVKELAKKSNPAVRKKIMAQYTVTTSRLKAFEKAVSEAELALTMTRPERIESFIFIYDISKVNSARNNGTTSLKSPQANGHTNGNSICAVMDIKKDVSGDKKESASLRVEQLCNVCEEDGVNIICSGKCLRSFHTDCLGLLRASGSFLCDECLTEKHACFACENADGDVRKCSLNNCGKFYHPSCLQEYPVADKDKFICPLHACLTCYNENPKNPNVYRVRLAKCFRCPIAYHARDNCMAAGCVDLSPFNIVCPEHFVPTKEKPYQSVINISWCFNCASGGELICCESCPAAFHASCLDIEIPEGKYTCEECLSKNHLCYGRIVWVKIGPFQWWPARILKPSDVPLNVQNMKSFVGEFPIQYFGTKEYYWTHKGRVYPYSEEDLHTVNNDSKVDSSKKMTTLKAKYKLSLEEAAEAFKKWTEERFNDEQTSSSSKRVPPYKHIKTNRPIGKVQIYAAADPSTLSRCSCEASDENPCGYDSQCLNRTMLVECHPSVCKAGDKCQNQMFQKLQYPNVQPFKTNNRGWALKALQDIKMGHFVSEYVGDLIDEEECKRRLVQKHEEDDTDYYFLTLDKGRIIDAGPKGNFSRFMNHSCSPNCETQKWIVNGDVRVGLFAKCDIPAGAELTFDYKLDSMNNAMLKCLCGAPNCQGKIGAKSNGSIKQEHTNEKVLKKPKKKKSTHSRLKVETLCYVCQESGQLILCDRKGCTKGYHLECLKRDRIPPGRWQCPWHYCDTCGRVSKFLCAKCPNSFCEKHKTDDNMTLQSGELVCLDHTEDAVSITDFMEVD